LDSLELAHRCVEIALEKKCQDILLLDVRERTVLADYFLVCTARNKRQLKAVAEAVASEAPRPKGRVRHVEGADGARWVLMDLGDVVIHAFDPDARTFYDLESLWADAPRVRLKELTDAAKAGQPS
jgi:ribosome-associated protein